MAGSYIKLASKVGVLNPKFLPGALGGKETYTILSTLALNVYISQLVTGILLCRRFPGAQSYPGPGESASFTGFQMSTEPRWQLSDGVYCFVSGNPGGRGKGGAGGGWLR